ncbi:hypothetical protein Tco_1500708 [Tanacetum coccineum]
MGRSEASGILNRKAYGEVRMGTHRIQIWILHLHLPSSSKWTSGGLTKRHRQGHEAKVGEESSSLDILEERREISSIREAHYKQKLERYYNKRVLPSTFKLGTYLLRLNNASKAEFQRKIGPTWEGPYVVRKVYRDGAYKLETLSGSPDDRTWNGWNLRKFYMLMRFLALGWLLEEIYVTWAHLEKKRTKLRTYTKSLEDFFIQCVKTASQA